jgi:Bacterial archaeo-eukaryotic release factor family 10
MISLAQVEKLLQIQAAEASVLSLYLSVPMDPDELRGLPARAGELYALAARGGDGPGAVRVQEWDKQVVRRLLEGHARDWLGHTVAIFTCAQPQLTEAIALPGQLPERAVLATRPHVRPLLVALQRCPAYLIAVIDQHHAWLLRVAGERIDTVARSDVTESSARSVRSHGFGGWYGLESYRVNERIIELARHHYHDTAAIIEQASRADGNPPLVVGGHEQTIPQLVAAFPAGLRDRVAGTFAADPHTLTPARARALAAPVIGDWVSAREQHLVSQLSQEPPGRLIAMGLQACLTAVNQHAVALLVAPVGGLVPGFCCALCGALSSTGDGCPDGAVAAGAVPDLIEEMVVRSMDDGGQVEAVRDPPGEVAARLRFPPTELQ